jgi:hypothetical protein
MAAVGDREQRLARGKLALALVTSSATSPSWSPGSVTGAAPTIDG